MDSNYIASYLYDFVASKIDIANMIGLVGGIFYENYPGGTGLLNGSVFGRLAGICLFASLIGQLVILPATIALFRKIVPKRAKPA